MKRLIVVLLFVLASTFCLGMGGLGGQPEGTIPDTDVRVQAKIVDRSGISSTLNQFSMDGKTYLNANRGQGKLTIPFQHIETIIFSHVNDETVDVEVKLKSGNTMSMTVNNNALFYGSTGYGAFQIKAGDVTKIDIQ